MMDGILIIDKSQGPTSHDVVSSTRKLLRIKKVGHTGTLDPSATGVLPLVLGKATKIARYLSGNDKCYRAVVQLGVNTDTLDREGTVTQERPVHVTEEQLREVVEGFKGAIEQLPPMFSAKKIGGKRLYELARKGVEVERDPKSVTIHRIDIVNFALPQFTLDVRCTAGTYLRTLAEDIGNQLGCGGHLWELRRTSSGSFDIKDAITMDALADDPSLVQSHIIPIETALQCLPSIRVPQSMGKKIATGHQINVADLRVLDIPEFAEDTPIAVALDSGQLVAVTRSLMPSTALCTSRRDHRVLKTERVFLSNP